MGEWSWSCQTRKRGKKHASPITTTAATTATKAKHCCAWQECTFNCTLTIAPRLKELPSATPHDMQRLLHMLSQVLQEQVRDGGWTYTW